MQQGGISLNEGMVVYRAMLNVYDIEMTGTMLDSLPMWHNNANEIDHLHY